MTDYLERAKRDLDKSYRAESTKLASLFAQQAQAAARIVQAEFLRSISVDLNIIMVDQGKIIKGLEELNRGGLGEV